MATMGMGFSIENPGYCSRLFLPSTTHCSHLPGQTLISCGFQGCWRYRQHALEPHPALQSP